MQNKLEFVIGTHSFLIKIILDKNFEIVNFQNLDTGHHYGIALPEDSNKHFLAKSFGIKRYLRNDETDVFSLKEKIMFPNNYRYEHQIAYKNDGVYVANTEFNSIGYFKLDGTQHIQHHFNNSKIDTNHINSVYPLFNDFLLVLLHNHQNKSQMVKLNHLANRFEVKEIIDLDYSGCHNIYRDDSVTIYNASQNGLLIINDTKSGKRLETFSFPDHHTKGLSLTADYIIVGHSENAEREARNFTNSYLSFISRQDFKLLATVNINHKDLPHSVGNVNEIRCLSEKDHAHCKII